MKNLITIAEFKAKIKAKDVKGNRTYLYAKVNNCKYGQSYQNTTQSIEDMKNSFVVAYYPFIQDAYDSN